MKDRSNFRNRFTVNGVVTNEALKLGASKEEILECIGVAVSLGGTTAEDEATRLIGYLEERGLI